MTVGDEVMMTPGAVRAVTMGPLGKLDKDGSFSQTDIVSCNATLTAAPPLAVDT